MESQYSQRGLTGQTLPDKFKCHIGGEWKASSKFSKNQHVKWFNLKRRNPRATPERAGLVCSAHQGGPSQELKCYGPCGLDKARERFSNAQRRAVDPWCEECVMWASRQEADRPPPPPPNTLTSPDEGEHKPTAGPETLDFFEFHATEGAGAGSDHESDDSEDDVTMAPSTSASVTSTMAKISNLQLEPGKQSVTSNTESGTSGGRLVRAKDYPEAQNPPGSTFHAWGPEGQHATRKVPGFSQASDASSVAPAESSNRETSSHRLQRGKWAKPTNKKNFDHDPNTQFHPMPSEIQDVYDDDDSDDTF